MKQYTFRAMLPPIKYFVYYTSISYFSSQNIISVLANLFQIIKKPNISFCILIFGASFYFLKCDFMALSI